MNTMKNGIAIMITIMFILTSAGVILAIGATGAKAEWQEIADVPLPITPVKAIKAIKAVTISSSCETRCLTRDLVTGECIAWVTDCYDN